MNTISDLKDNLVMAPKKKRLPPAAENSRDDNRTKKPVKLTHKGDDKFRDTNNSGDHTHSGDHDRKRRASSYDVVPQSWKIQRVSSASSLQRTKFATVEDEEEDGEVNFRHDQALITKCTVAMAVYSPWALQRRTLWRKFSTH